METFRSVRSSPARRGVGSGRVFRFPGQSLPTQRPSLDPGDPTPLSLFLPDCAPIAHSAGLPQSPRHRCGLGLRRAPPRPAPVDPAAHPGRLQRSRPARAIAVGLTGDSAPARPPACSPPARRRAEPRRGRHEPLGHEGAGRPPRARLLRRLGWSTACSTRSGVLLRELSSGEAIVASVDAYTPGSNGWTAKASLPEARYSLNCTGTINGVLYVAGGRNTSPGRPRPSSLTRPPNTGSTKAPMNIGGACRVTGASPASPTSTADATRRTSNVTTRRPTVGRPWPRRNPGTPGPRSGSSAGSSTWPGDRGHRLEPAPGGLRSGEKQLDDQGPHAHRAVADRGGRDRWTLLRGGRRREQRVCRHRGGLRPREQCLAQQGSMPTARTGLAGGVVSGVRRAGRPGGERQRPGRHQRGLHGR